MCATVRYTEIDFFIHEDRKSNFSLVFDNDVTNIHFREHSEFYSYIKQFFISCSPLGELQRCFRCLYNNRTSFCKLTTLTNLWHCSWSTKSLSYYFSWFMAFFFLLVYISYIHSLLNHRTAVSEFWKPSNTVWSATGNAHSKIALRTAEEYSCTI